MNSENISAGPVQRANQRHYPLRMKVALALVSLVLSLCLGELAAQATLFMFYGPPLPENKRIHEYDPELGWRNRRAFRAPDRYGPGEHATHNRRGFRSTREFSQQVPVNHHRILFVGDSFTYGIIGDDKTFPAAMERLVPNLESVNMGGAGFGVDQMYLWYRREGTLAAQEVVIAVIADDFNRMGMDAFMTRYPKPILRVEHDRLQITNVPVPTWGAASPRPWYADFPNRLALVQIARKVRSTYLVHYDPYAAAERIMDELSALTRTRGHTPIYVYLPIREELDQPGTTRTALWLAGQCSKRHQRFVDLTPSFKALAPAERASLFQRDGHYTEAGNRRVAELISTALTKLVPGFPSH
jgi:hypothetical protein